MTRFHRIIYHNSVIDLLDYYYDFDKYLNGEMAVFFFLFFNYIMYK